MGGLSNHGLYNSIIIMTLIPFAQHSSDYLLKNRGGTDRAQKGGVHVYTGKGARQLFQVKTLTPPPVRIM